MWASSTTNAFRISHASKSHLNPALSCCFSNVLDGLKYASLHGCVKHEGAVATIGITNHKHGSLNVGFFHSQCIHDWFGFRGHLCSYGKTLLYPSSCFQILKWFHKRLTNDKDKTRPSSHILFRLFFLL
ncbi:hypothetical protein I3760_11G062600 [Carya illinoinensis]|nr:hypothetical protein I3760_11G062600 [Carya illinoinensis]